MSKKCFISLISIFLLAFTIHAEITVKVVRSSGDVMVRYGLDENWQAISIGSILRDIDTILTGEKSETLLKFESGATFILGSNAVLDIGDLRKIYEKELFLYLMSKKVESIEPRYEKTPLRIGNVSVVHGESKENDENEFYIDTEQHWAQLEINGAVALQDQAYYPNAVIKYHNILDKYPEKIDQAKVYFYIANSLEALEMNGQAIDAFEIVIDSYNQKSDIDTEGKKRLIASQEAIERLKSEY